jgi:hypothetical protein
VGISTGNSYHSAGADIKEMKDKSFADAYKTNFLGSWGRVTGMRKPIIGAVAGYAVGTSLCFEFLVGAESEGGGLSLVVFLSLGLLFFVFCLFFPCLFPFFFRCASSEEAAN